MSSRCWSVTMLAVAVFVSGVSDSLQASLIHVGNDTATADAWRTTDSGKPLDADGDNVYGTDGYFVTFASLLNPPTIVDVTAIAPYTQNSANHALIDDPQYTGPGPVTDASGGDFFYDNVAPGVENDFFQIVLQQDGSFRMAVLNDIGSGFSGGPDSAVKVRVRQTVGGSADTGLIDVASSINNVPDYYLFDISGVAGDTYIISGVNDNTTSYNALGGLAFDNVTTVPEPSSFVLTAMGLFGAVRAAKRRNRGANP